MPLPQPSPDALAHSERVRSHIVAEIHRGGGWLDFARYMELALYAPGLGYYSAGAAKFGAGGDFVTAPEISNLFGRTLARPVAGLLDEFGGDILEIGAGSGKLALDVLSELAALQTLPVRYCILEISADLRERQRELLREKAPALIEHVLWLDALPAAFHGVVLGNEVLDAMPVHLLHWRRDDVVERGVTWQDGRLVWQDRPLRSGELRRAAERIAPGEDYLSEMSLAVPAFVRSIAGMLSKGAVLFADYGFRREEYYHAQRNRGTLMCHYRHHVHEDPFFLTGLQDMTAHVDFSLVAEVAVDAGLEVSAFLTQAKFLIESGITELLSEVDPRDAKVYLPLANQVQRLVSPAEMGELFKVMVLTTR